MGASSLRRELDRLGRPFRETLPVSVAEMMSPPFLPKDTRLTNNQLKLWKFFNNRAMKKVRKRLGA